MNPLFQTVLASMEYPKLQLSIDKSLETSVFTVAGIILVIAVIIGVCIGKKRNESIYGPQESPECVVDEARVVEKTAEWDSLVKTNVYRIVFEKQGGERLCLAVKNIDLYQTIVKDDVGTVRYEGKTLVSFTR